jgi:hypothetical protein
VRSSQKPYSLNPVKRRVTQTEKWRKWSLGKFN